MVFGLFKKRAPVATKEAAAPETQHIQENTTPMLGLMQNWPLTVDRVLEHARINHGHREVVTRSVAGPIVRTTYSRIYDRAKQTSEALQERGIQMSDRVATLAWNSDIHMET